MTCWTVSEVPSTVSECILSLISWIVRYRKFNLAQIKFEITQLYCCFVSIFSFEFNQFNFPDFRKTPTVLEYFSYLFSFHNVMVGPTVFFNDYIKFIEGSDGSYESPVCLLSFCKSKMWHYDFQQKLSPTLCAYLGVILIEKRICMHGL